MKKLLISAVLATSIAASAAFATSHEITVEMPTEAVTVGQTMVVGGTTYTVVAILAGAVLLGLAAGGGSSSGTT